MNIKKCFFVFITIFSSVAYSETELEVLWDKAISYSIDIASADVSLRNTIKASENKRSLYPVNLRFSTESSFSDVYEDITWYPSSAKICITVAKSNPYGNTISGSITYGVGRSILNFLQPVDSENIGYHHTPEVNLSIEQSLYPAYLQGYIKNPEVLLLKNKVKNAEYFKKDVEISIKQNVANLYVQERNIIRQIEKYKKTLNLYDEKIDALYELYEKSQGSLSDVWNLENKKWDCYKEYIESVNTKESIELSLKNICGETIFVSSTKSAFPNFNIPEIEYNPTIEQLVLEIENITLENVISKQSSAPKLFLEGTFSENTTVNRYFTVNYVDDKTNFNWSFSLGVSFSEFFSPSRRLKQMQYEDELILSKKCLKNVEEQNYYQKDNYEKLITLYEKQIKRLESVIENRQALNDNYELLYKTGQCSKLEFDEVNLSVIEAECIYENLCDYLWLYRWLRTQCR